IVRSERAASDAYRRALERTRADYTPCLRHIRADHLNAIATLACIGGPAVHQVLEEEISQGVGVQSLPVLKQEEEMILEKYQIVAGERGIEEPLKTLARDTLIPRQKQHIGELTVLIGH